MSEQPMNALFHLILANPRSFERADLPCALWGHHEAALVALERNALAPRSWVIEANKGGHIGIPFDAGIRAGFVSDTDRRLQA